MVLVRRYVAISRSATAAESQEPEHSNNNNNITNNYGGGDGGDNRCNTKQTEEDSCIQEWNST